MTLINEHQILIKNGREFQACDLFHKILLEYYKMA